MEPTRFDRLVVSLVRPGSRPGSRRGLLRLLAAVPVVSTPFAAPSVPAPFAALLGEEGEAAKREKQVGADKKKKCARLGQTTSKKRKRCCSGLVKQGKVCVQPSPPPSPPPSCATPGPCQTGPGTVDPATGQCVYPHKPNGAPCGTASQPGGGTTRCCNGACPEPICIPYGRPVPGVTTCEACLADIPNKCCGKDGGCTSGSGAVQCLCGASSGSCGSDADCPFTGTPACICGSCQAPPS